MNVQGLLDFWKKFFSNYQAERRLLLCASRNVSPTLNQPPAEHSLQVQLLQKQNIEWFAADVCTELERACSGPISRRLIRLADVREAVACAVWSRSYKLTETETDFRYE